MGITFGFDLIKYLFKVREVRRLGGGVLFFVCLFLIMNTLTLHGLKFPKHMNEFIY